MSRQERFWTLFFLGLAVLASGLLATGLSGLELQPGRPFPFWLSLPLPGARGPWSPGEPGMFDLLLRGLLALLIFIIIPLWLIIFIISPRARKEMLKRIPTYIIWALIIYSLYRMIRRLNPIANPEDEGVFSAGAATPAVPGTLLIPPEFVAAPPQWLIISVTATLLVLLFAVAWFFWQRARRQASPLTLLAQEAYQALEQLHTGADLTDTIRRCYGQMGQVLSQERGIHRQKAMTPREFEQYLAAAGVGDEHIQRLTRLFERFRYGSAVAGEGEEAEAIACLDQIVQAYGRAS